MIIPSKISGITQPKQEKDLAEELELATVALDAEKYKNIYLKTKIDNVADNFNKRIKNLQLRYQAHYSIIERKNLGLIQELDKAQREIEQLKNQNQSTVEPGEKATKSLDENFDLKVNPENETVRQLKILTEKLALSEKQNKEIIAEIQNSGNRTQKIALITGAVTIGLCIFNIFASKQASTAFSGNKHP